jgi:hypothetical protein
MPEAGCQSAAKVTSAAPGPVPGETTDSLWLTALAHNPEANGREAHSGAIAWRRGRGHVQLGHPTLSWIVSGYAVIQDLTAF